MMQPDRERRERRFRNLAILADHIPNLYLASDEFREKKLSKHCARNLRGFAMGRPRNAHCGS